MFSAAAYPRLVQEPLTAAEAPRSARQAIGFTLFLLVNAALFIRPAEVFQPLGQMPVYEFLILGCLALSLDGVLEQLRPATLASRPISLCVLGLMAAVALSHVSHMATAPLMEMGTTFAKILVYYLLLMAVVDTPRRLHVFLVWLGLLTGFLALLPLLQYYGFISLPDLTPVQERTVNAATGETQAVNRVRGIGIFGDPNDLSHMLAAGVPLCLYAMADRSNGKRRLLWLIPVGLALYTIVLTKSRGGLLALVAGLGAFSLARFGWRKSLLMLLLMMPLMIVVFAQRQSDGPGSVDTRLERIQMWSDAIVVFRQYPLFGLGAGEFGGNGTLVAHNSFVQAFAELGFLGGMLFFGIFYMAMRTLGRLCREPEAVLDHGMRRMLPYLLGAVAAYVAGMLSLTRNYLVPPYTIAGLVAAYLATVPVADETLIPMFGGRLLRRLVGMAILCVMGLYIFVRLTVRW